MVIMIVWDVGEMSEREKLIALLDGLSQEVARELQWNEVKSFLEAISTIMHLAGYDASVRSQKSQERSP